MCTNGGDRSVHCTKPDYVVHFWMNKRQKIWIDSACFAATMADYQVQSKVCILQIVFI